MPLKGLPVPKLPGPHYIRGNKAPPVKPFLKWAGGKSRILPILAPYLPREFKSYFEPFLGGGGMHFSLRPTNAVLSDINPGLIQCYSQVRDNVEQVIRTLSRWKFSKTNYYWVRDDYKPQTDVGKAARFIYLNKTCWNGLYRENLAGKFNVPIGSRPTSQFLYRDELRACADALRGARIECCDFLETIKEARPGDFVYFDPPYVTGHNNNGFIHSVKSRLALLI